jgi:hypothetical protein
MVLEAGKSMTKLLADLVCTDGTFFVLRTKQCLPTALWGLFYKNTNLINEGSALMSLSSPKGCISKYHHMGDILVQYMHLG